MGSVLKATDSQISLSSIEEAISEFQAGRMVIIVDDRDRENEGDLAIATEKLTVEHVRFMMQHARGLICVSISEEAAERLDLAPQVENNNSRYSTPFAVSIDSAHWERAGVTALARTKTMRDLIRLDTTPADFVSPGHVFPLVANPAGVMGRQGQTEGSYDLAILSELAPSAVICEILNHDGTMARGVELNQFAELHKLKIISVEQLMRYRIEREVLVRKVACNVMSTSFGEFETHVFEDDVDDKEHLALCYGDVAAACSAGRAVPVRIHSECLTGDVFGSQRCDCGAQLQTAMEYIIDHGVGILLYLRQEGRGIGLANKLRAYQLQDQGRDTVEANVELGFEADARDFAVAAKMLMALEIEKVQLLTNNPRKLSVLDTYGISVAERIPLIEWSESCAEYLRAKKSKLGHLL